MNKTRQPRLLDIVAVLNPPDDADVEVGDVGTVVKVLPPDGLRDGPLPRLSYVTDSGDNETSYYDKVLSRMKHPRTGEPLEWIRVADYYHASERLWTMAEFAVWQRPKSDGLGAEDAKVVAEAERRQPRAALGSGLTAAAELTWQEAAGV
jgi:hypothetical protein